MKIIQLFYKMHLDLCLPDGFNLSNINNNISELICVI